LVGERSERPRRSSSNEECDELGSSLIEETDYRRCRLLRAPRKARKQRL
jgi:hypothetical protein